MNYQIYTKVPSFDVLQMIASCANGGVPELKETSASEIEEKLEGRNRVVVQVALLDGKTVGFKIGYELRPRLFYSWLGGVHEDFRRRGFGSELMNLQHEFCQKEGYESIRTISANNNREIIVRNVRSGYDIADVKQKGSETRVVFEKRLRYSH